MIKMPVKYTDFDDKEVEEDLYFHFSKAELMEMALEDEDLGTKLQRIGESGDAKIIMATFKDLVGKAYGVRSGSARFVKSEDLTNEFLSSPAFDALLEILLTDTNAAVNFVNGIVPKDLQEQVIQTRQLENVEVKEVVLGPFTAAQSGLRVPKNNQGQYWPWAFRAPTNQELREMPREQMLDVHHRLSQGWTPPDGVEPV